MFSVQKDAEIKLVDTVAGISEETSYWRAIYFNFDRLTEQYRNDYQLQIAVNLLNDLLAAHQGGIFVCHDSCIILVCRNVMKMQLDKAIFQLRYLFIDDPLAYLPNGEECKDFCRIFDLGADYAEFHQLCHKKLMQASQLQAILAEKAATANEDKALNIDGSSKIFTPTQLTHIAYDLKKADMSKVLRRQSVCAVTQDYNIRKVFDEFYIHIAKLRQMLRTNADLFSNRWLFRYLTQVLDDRMLDTLLINPLLYFDTPISLNLNIETLLSSKFRAFDAALKGITKFSVVIEVQLSDVFNDISGFMAAKNIVNEMGYKLCLDGLTSMNIIHIKRERLGFDLAKLQWNADVENDLKKESNAPIIDAVKEFGQNRVILTRCDIRDAISYGQALGINLFQGRFLDRILNPNMKAEN